MPYTDDMDAKVKSASRWYWNRHLRQTTIQYDDVLQFCRLQVLDRQIPRNHLWLQLPWLISKAFVERGRLAANFDSPYIESAFPRDIEEFRKSLVQDRLLRELRAQQASILSLEQRERFVENLWVVGHPGTYAALMKMTEGTPRDNKRGGIDSNYIKRGVVMLRRAFPTLADLLGTDRAAWLPMHARKAMRLYALGQGLDCQISQGVRRSLAPMIDYHAKTKTLSLTDAGRRFVMAFPEEQKRFLARQM